MMVNVERLEIEIARAQMTYTALAGAAGLSKNTLGNIRRTGRAYNTTVGRLAEALKVPVETLASK